MEIMTDFSKAYAMMSGIQKKEFPFAASVAMNSTFKQLVKKDGHLASTMDRHIDRGANPFTKRGFYAYFTRKNRLSGFIAVKDKNSYLDTIIFGGTVKPLKGNQFLIQPVNQKKNKYGNIPRNTLARKSANTKDYFKPKKPMIGKYGVRPYGLYKHRPKRAPQLIIKYSEKTRDQRGFYPAGRDAARYYKRHFPTNFNIAMKNAVMSSNYRVATGF